MPIKNNFNYKKVTTTYRSVNLIRLVEVTKNFPVRLLALRMLWLSRGKLKSFYVLRIKQIDENLEMNNQILFEKVNKETLTDALN